MNILGTHDTERALTVLGKGNAEVTWETGSVLAHKKLTQRQRTIAIKKMVIAATIQYTVYGVPSLYYGDEAGLEGYHDPFCRLPFPWGREDERTMLLYRRLGALREEYRELFATGEFRVLDVRDGFIAYERYNKTYSIIVAANAKKDAVEYKPFGDWTELGSGQPYGGTVGGFGCVILKKEM